MNELSLFSGAGGGVLGSKILGWRTIGYVEYEKYCQEVLKQRIADGILDAAPIYGDIRKFISDGYAEQYRGFTDILTGGFPCQPFSIAGKRAGEDDPRNMWPATIECVRLVRPRYCFFENVPGLLSSGYFPRILADLSQSGYSAKWTCLGADDIGANHRRKRLWILAYTAGGKDDGRERGNLADPAEGRESINPAVDSGREDVADAASSRQFQMADKPGEERKKVRGSVASVGSEALENSDGQRCEEQWESIPEGEAESESKCTGWWKSEPPLGRLASGIPGRVDMLKALGNAQVPLCMARAFQILSEGII